MSAEITSAEEAIAKLAARLEFIASKNDDRFVYAIVLERCRAGWVFEFIAKETADGHVFVSGTGITLVEACANAEAHILEACEAWGYQNAVLPE